jgi:uncharacterized membrane protein YgcG
MKRYLVTILLMCVLLISFGISDLQAKGGGGGGGFSGGGGSRGGSSSFSGGG